MDAIKGMLGIKTSAEKAAEASAKQAQLTAARQAEGDAVQQAGQQSVGARLARAAGMRILAFQGATPGAGLIQTQQPSATLGGG